MSNTSPLNKDDIKIVATLLSKLKPGFLLFDIFHEVSRLTVIPIIELVPLRKDNDEIEVLLLKRDDDDPVWPGQLHTPGTVVRSSDTPGSFADAFDRILSGELRVPSSLQPVFVKSILHYSGRGMEVSQIYWVEVTGNPKVGQFYNARQLPANIIRSQLDFIPDAITHYSVNS